LIILGRLARGPQAEVNTLGVLLHNLENQFYDTQGPSAFVGIFHFKMCVHVIVEEVEPYLRIEEASTLLGQSNEVFDGLKKVPGSISWVEASPRAVSVKIWDQAVPHYLCKLNEAIPRFSLHARG